MALFNCDVEGCPRGYTRRAHLDNHLRRKHPEAYTKLLQASNSTRKVIDQAGPSAAKAPHGLDASAVVHEDEFLPEIPLSPMTKLDNIATAFGGVQLLRDAAVQARSITMANRQEVGEALAKDLEKLAFGLDFLYKELKETDFRNDREKARKWDKLVELLPVMERFVQDKEG